jgi:hypothetical protein
MSTKLRKILIGLSGAALLVVFSPAIAAARGGGNGGHMSGGTGAHSSSGFSGHTGGAWNGGHSAWEGSHVGAEHWGQSGHGWNYAGRNEAWGRNWAEHPNARYYGHDWGLNHGHAWDHDHDWWRDYGHNHWTGWWRYGNRYPWYGYGWGWPSIYGYAGYGYYPYTDYGYDYYGDTTPYAATYAPSDVSEAPADVPAANPAPAAESGDFYSEALSAFREGDYRNAARLAGHASIDEPRDSNVHALLMLSLFAIGEYRPAAMEAHAVATLGKTPNWPAVYEMYGKIEPFTEQLRALEKYVRENASAPEGRFLLGFQYMMMGHPDVARVEFLDALKLTPRDQVAARLLTQVGGTVPADVARQAQHSAPKPMPTLTPEKK